MSVNYEKRLGLRHCRDVIWVLTQTLLKTFKKEEEPWSVAGK